MSDKNRIGRRVYITTCHCIMYDENNEKVEIDVPIYGAANDISRAQTKVQKQLGTNRVIVQDMEIESHYYSMTTEAFIKYADNITD